jgi:hypothetical protein
MRISPKSQLRPGGCGFLAPRLLFQIPNPCNTTIEIGKSDLRTIRRLTTIYVTFLVGLCPPAAFADCSAVLRPAKFSEFSATDKRKLNSLRRQNWSEANSKGVKTRSRAELLDWTTVRLRALGFQTRVAVIGSPDARLLVVEIRRAPDDLPFGKVINRVIDIYKARTFIDPTLLRSVEMTEAYFDEARRPQIVLDLMEIKDLKQISQPFLHEVRHLDLMAQRLNGKAGAFQGELVAVTKGYRLLSGDPAYAEYISLEELSTYYRDAMVAMGRFKRGEIPKSKFMATLRWANMIATAVVKHIDMLDFNLDPELIDFNPRQKTIGYPIYGETRTALAQFNYELPDLPASATQEQAIILFRAHARADRQRASALAEFAQAALAGLKAGP